MSRKRACQSPPPITNNARTLPRMYTTNSSGNYIPGLSDRQRVDMVLQQLHEQHRWSLKSFIYHLVTAHTVEKNAISTENRTRKLFEAIYEQEEVMAKLCKIPGSIDLLKHSQLVARIRNELSQFKKDEVGLGQFVSEQMVDQLRIPDMASRVQSAAPNLWALLVGIMTQRHPSSRDTSEEYQGNIFMICMILASAFAPRTCDKFLILIGLHLHSMGVKRRTINLLHGLGVTSHYATIMRRRIELVQLGKVVQ